MKKLFTLVILITISFYGFAQVPQKMSYQAVIRNPTGILIANQSVGMKLSILQGSPSGTIIFEEIYNPNPQTNVNGLVIIEIGGGTPLTGTFSAINWANGPYFIKNEIDPSGGTNYTIIGTSQLLSVPYAIYSNVAENISIQGESSGDIMFFNGTNWVRLAKGTTGQILAMDNSGIPIWVSFFDLPQAITNLCSEITINSATLDGTANGNNLTTSVGFEYGTTTDYGTMIAAVQSPIKGFNNINVNADITGLPPNTTYHYRVKAVNTLGTTYGNDMSFNTLGNSPTAITNSVSNLTINSATLRGTVNANFFNSVVTFEYGTTTAYGTVVNAAQSPVGGSVNTAVSADILNLAPNTTYHYRVKAVNTLGTTVGNDISFKTLGQAPTAVTQPSTSVMSTSAQINGTVNANFFSSTVTFEYGISTSYGTTIAATQSPVTGSSNTAVNVNISGLTKGTTYHYRVVAVNLLGTTYGSDMIFTANLGIGEIYGGGIIFYVDNTFQHGYIAATSDQGKAIWGCQGVLFGTGTLAGTGSANTTAIINGCTTAGIAAKLCRSYTGGGNNDWYLPSRGELDLLFAQRDVVGGFVTTGGTASGYWSSTEHTSEYAWAKYFETGGYGGNSRNYSGNVRPIRSF